MPTNTMVTHFTPAIVLSPTGNLQGTYKFLSLTGNWKEGQATCVHAVPHAGLGHQEGQSVWQVDHPAYFSNETRKWTSFPKGSLTLRTSSSTPPLLQNTQEWCLGKINPCHRSKRNSCLKGKPKTLQLAMPTSSRYVAGVAAAPIAHANADKLGDYKIDDDDGIIAVEDICPNNSHSPNSQ